MLDIVAGKRYRDISLAIEANVAIVTLNRPAKLNAYTLAMGEELVEVLSALKTWETGTAVIITGAGNGFCAGADYNYLETVGQQNDQGDMVGSEYFLNGFCCELFNYPKVLIAAVNGIAVGLGVTMTLPCDFRLAAESASFAMPFLKNNIMPGFGSSYLLPRLVGLSQAKELIYSGKTVSAQDAQTIGLVSRVLPDQNFLQGAVEIANSLAAHPPELLSAAKARLQQGFAAGSLADTIAFECS